MHTALTAPLCPHCVAYCVPLLFGTTGTGHVVGWCVRCDRTTHVTRRVRAKRCGRCRREKPASAFWKNRRRADGQQSQCIECQRPSKRSATARAYQRALYHQRKEQAR